MAVQQQTVSRKANDGSRSDMQDNGYDEERYESRDKRAPTRTTFYESDIDRLDTTQRRKRRLKRALRRQEGEDQGEAYSTDHDQRQQQNRKEWKRRMVTTYASQLDLTPAQRDRSQHIVMGVVSIDSFGPYSTEEVILAVINVVVREDGRWIEDEELFRDLVRDVGIVNSAGRADLDTMESLRSMVRERVPSKSK